MLAEQLVLVLTGHPRQNADVAAEPRERQRKIGCGAARAFRGRVGSADPVTRDVTDDPDVVKPQRVLRGS